MQLFSVPISELPRLIRETSEDFEKRGLLACHFGYVPLVCPSHL